MRDCGPLQWAAVRKQACLPLSSDTSTAASLCASLDASAAEIGRTAVRSLHSELVLYPKPGLVSLIDTGSHRDMDASTFVRSMFALRRYFFLIARAGAEVAPFHVLRDLGIAAEERMLAATGGINTHRGAIFSLGLLCAAAGHSVRLQEAPTPAGLRSSVLANWGDALRGHRSSAVSHGSTVAAHYAASGAREEAARGFPSIFELALPRLQQTLDAGRSMRCARIDALFSLMAHMSDTNVYHRGGPTGAAIVRQAARSFLAAGSTAAPDWLAQATACHRIFVERNLSPGGAADLLAATEFVHAVTQCTAVRQPVGACFID